jgi:hypothetical protein
VPIIDPSVPLAEEAPTDGYFASAKSKNTQGAKDLLAYLASPAASPTAPSTRSSAASACTSGWPNRAPPEGLRPVPGRRVGGRRRGRLAAVPLRDLAAAARVNTVVFAVTVIDSLRTFDIVWAMTAGGPYHSSELLSTYMFEQGFTLLKLGYSSAIAVVIFALAIVFIITYRVRATKQEVD